MRVTIETDRLILRNVTPEDYLAWFSAGGMSNNRNNTKAEICGDYAVYRMPFGEDYFMFVDIGGYGEYVPDYSK